MLDFDEKEDGGSEWHVVILITNLFGIFTNFSIDHDCSNTKPNDKFDIFKFDYSREFVDRILSMISHDQNIMQKSTLTTKIIH